MNIQRIRKTENNRGVKFSRLDKLVSAIYTS